MEPVELGDLLPPIIILILTGGLTSLFAYKRKTTNVNALDWMIGIFATTFIMGLVQIFKLYFQDEWVVFSLSKGDHALFVDPVKFFHFAALIILYFMCEQFLSDSFNNLRISILTSLVSLYVFASLYYLASGEILLTSTFLPMATQTSIGSIIFDLIQLYIAILLTYVYYAQYHVSESVTIRNNLRILLVALAIFVVASVIEVFEVFIPGLEPYANGFLLMIPTFLIISIFYARNPNFVYLAPSKVLFLQVVSSAGQLFYAVEFKETMDTSDFLVAPSLTSVNTILGELVGERDLQLSKFEYDIGDNDNGYIVFERIGENLIILQTNRPAGILKRAMRYFLREFNKEFESQIINFSGHISVNDKNISPDDVLRMCIPIVQAKPLISSYAKSEKAKNVPKLKDN
ncbi:MAG: hypothetical protein INQ03_17665 [Candidatus Heimdallarchaeota archaeon]|nr:hypothetical protein [Candidatus Heimdallarchaeota archaeon]